jgi:hypothetical protein
MIYVHTVNSMEIAHHAITHPMFIKINVYVQCTIMATRLIDVFVFNYSYLGCNYTCYTCNNSKECTGCFDNYSHRFFQKYQCWC